MRCETGEFPIKIIQGDSYRRVYKFYDTDGNVMDNSSISSVVLSVSRLNYTQTLNWNAAEEGYVFILSADTTAEFPYCKGTYDVTLNFRDTQVSTQVYQSSWQIFEKDVFYNTITNNNGYMTCENSEVVIKTGITVSAGGTDDHSQLINRNLPNQHPMSAITGLEDALEGKQPSGDYATTQELDELAEIVEGKADADDIPTVNDGVLIIKQNGIVKGSFGANSAQNVEINLDGGSSGQGWTAEQITLLETVFANIVYIDQTTGQEAARQLIESLRGVVPSEYDITQVGNTLIISRAPATKSNDTLIIT